MRHTNETFTPMTTNLHALRPEAIALMDHDTFATYKLHLVIGESVIRAAEFDYWTEQTAAMRGDGRPSPT